MAEESGGRQVNDETTEPEPLVVVARALRIEGDNGARRLAEQIEQVCSAAF